MIFSDEIIERLIDLIMEAQQQENTRLPVLKEQLRDKMCIRDRSYSYPQTEITISAKRLEHDIHITFENRGKTIPQEQLNSIFEKFNRLDDARLSNTGGAGLGQIGRAHV